MSVFFGHSSLLLQLEFRVKLEMLHTSFQSLHCFEDLTICRYDLVSCTLVVELVVDTYTHDHRHLLMAPAGWQLSFILAKGMHFQYTHPPKPVSSVLFGYFRGNSISR